MPDTQFAYLHLISVLLWGNGELFLRSSGERQERGKWQHDLGLMRNQKKVIKSRLPRGIEDEPECRF